MTSVHFKPTTTRFDLTHALKMSELSLIAYKSQKEIRASVEKLGYSQFKFFDSSNTQAFMVGTDEVIILSFRGTESIQDWITDLKIKFVQGPLGKVHKGFYAALMSIWKDVKEALLKFQRNSQSVWITGHSLGGALATLAVAALIEENCDVGGAYTFGQPRVGSEKFAKKLDSQYKYRFFRVVNNEDIVTRIPTRLMGYYHVGSDVYIDALGMLHRGPKWWFRFLDAAASQVVRSLDRFKALREQFPNGLEDHDIEKYLRRIKENLTRESRGRTT